MLPGFDPAQGALHAVRRDRSRSGQRRQEAGRPGPCAGLLRRPARPSQSNCPRRMPAPGRGARENWVSVYIWQQAAAGQSGKNDGRHRSHGKSPPHTQPALFVAGHRSAAGAPRCQTVRLDPFVLVTCIFDLTVEQGLLRTMVFIWGARAPQIK